MRVALITSNRKPEIGGGYTFEQEICNTLLRISNESGHDYFIVSDKDYQAADETDNVKFIYNGPPREKKSILERINRKKVTIQQKLKEKEIQFLWLAGATSPFETDIPYLSNVWDIQHRRQPFFPEVCANGLWEKRERDYSNGLQKAARIIAGNQIAKEEIELFYQIPSERIHVIPQMTPGFALGAGVFDINIKTKYGLPDNYLFYPAQFWPHKNHINLLTAIKELQEKHSIFFPLVLVGSDQGNLEYINETIKHLDLEQYVHVLGFVPQDDLVELYRNAFALIYVSLFGPENLPPLEAFALGCPVIAMNVPGLKQQLGDAALFAQPGDAGSIMQQIKLLHDNNSLYEELRKKGEQRARQWTSDNFVRCVFNILDEFQYFRNCWK